MITLDEGMRGIMRTQNGNAEQASFQIHIGIEDVSAFVQDGEHKTQVGGTVDIPSLGGRMAIENGQFRLFPKNPSTGQREMRYDLPFSAKDGTKYVLHGVKYLTDDKGLDIYADFTTLKTTITREDGCKVSSGDLVLDPVAIAKLTASFRTNSARDTLAFARFCAENVIDSYVLPKGAALRRR